MIDSGGIRSQSTAEIREATPFDPDFGKTGFARRMLRLRFRQLRLKQADFAERFGLTWGAVKDLEQGRTKPTRAMVLLIAAIEREPALMAKVAEAERDALAAVQGGGNRWVSGSNPTGARPL